MTSLCRYCAYEQSDCKGNKDLEKLKCEYYKKRPVQNVKQMAERIAELEAEVERLSNVQNMHSSDLISRANAIRWVKTECNQYGKPTIDYDSGLKVIEHLEKMPSADR